MAVYFHVSLPSSIPLYSVILLWKTRDFSRTLSSFSFILLILAILEVIYFIFISTWLFVAYIPNTYPIALSIPDNNKKKPSILRDSSQILTVINIMNVMSTVCEVTARNIRCRICLRLQVIFTCIFQPFSQGSSIRPKKSVFAHNYCVLVFAIIFFLIFDVQLKLISKRLKSITALRITNRAKNLIT